MCKDRTRFHYEEQIANTQSVEQLEIHVMEYEERAGVLLVPRGCDVASEAKSGNKRGNNLGTISVLGCCFPLSMALTNNAKLFKMSTLNH